MNNGYAVAIGAGLFVVAAVGCAAVATAGIALVALLAGAVAGGAAWVGLGLVEQIAQAGAVGLDSDQAAQGLIVDSTCEVIR